MVFSATGNLLPGSVQNPDIYIETVSTKHGRRSTPKICALNMLGYIPIVSTLTGLGRALLGIVHTIVHLARSIFSEHRKVHLNEASLGAKNIGRGLIEAVPVIGNITMAVIDRKRFENLNNKTPPSNTTLGKNQSATIIFFNGDEIQTIEVNDFENSRSRFSRQLNLNDLKA